MTQMRPLPSALVCLLMLVGLLGGQAGGLGQLHPRYARPPSRRLGALGMGSRALLNHSLPSSNSSADSAHADAGADGNSTASNNTIITNATVTANNTGSNTTSGSPVLNTTSPAEGATSPASNSTSPAAGATPPGSNSTSPARSPASSPTPSTQSPRPGTSPPAPSGTIYTMCLAGTRRNPQAISEAGDCAMLSQALQGSNVPWQRFTCSSSPPLVQVSRRRMLQAGGLESAYPVYYTCWNATVQSTYSRQLLAVWYATQPEIRPNLESALDSSYARAAAPPSLWAYFARAAQTMPIGSTAAVRSWFLLYSPESMTFSPPPPQRGNSSSMFRRSPPLPPPPAPPGIPSDPRCISSGTGYVLNVDGLELCVRPPSTPVVARPPSGDCITLANFTITNIGATGIPASGIRTALRVWLDGVKFAGLPSGDESTFLYQTSANAGATGFMDVSNVGTSTPPDAHFVLSIPVDCPPTSVPLPTRLTLLSGSLGQASDLKCPPDSLVARRGTASSSIQCYSMPQRANAAQAGLRRMDDQHEENGNCYGSISFNVTNQGNSSISSVWGPLVVNLEGAGLQLVRANLAVNATIVSGGTGSQYFNITDFGSTMEPNATSTFSLAVSCPGTCPCQDSAYVQFGTPVPPVCSVAGVSEVVGRTRGNVFDDGCCVQPEDALVAPLIIMADYRPEDPANGQLSPMSYLYVMYDGSTSGLPPMRGWLDWSAYSSIDVWNSVYGGSDDNDYSITNSSYTLINEGIVKVVIYSYNGLICGMDAWTQRLFQIFSDRQPVVPASAPPDTSVGCTPSNNYPPPQSTGPYTNATLVAPPNTYLGWFSGSEFESLAVTSLQAVWLSCRW